MADSGWDILGLVSWNTGIDSESDGGESQMVWSLYAPTRWHGMDICCDCNGRLWLTYNNSTGIFN